MKHIANVVLIRRLAELNRSMGKRSPIILTPDYFVGEEMGES